MERTIKKKKSHRKKKKQAKKREVTFPRSQNPAGTQDSWLSSRQHSIAVWPKRAGLEPDSYRLSHRHSTVIGALEKNEQVIFIWELPGIGE